MFWQFKNIECYLKIILEQQIIVFGGEKKFSWIQIDAVQGWTPPPPPSSYTTTCLQTAITITTKSLRSAVNLSWHYEKPALIWSLPGKKGLMFPSGVFNGIRQADDSLGRKTHFHNTREALQICEIHTIARRKEAARVCVVTLRDITRRQQTNTFLTMLPLHQ